MGRVVELLDVISFAGVEVLESFAGLLMLVISGDEDDIVSLLESVELETLVVELVMSFVEVEYVEELDAAAADT